MDKNGNGENQDAHNVPTDHQLQQFVPDMNVIGKSSQLEGKEIKSYRILLFSFYVENYLIKKDK